MSIRIEAHDYRKSNLNIDIIVSLNGKRYRKSTGFTVPATHWNKNKCSESRDRYPEGIKINKALKKWVDYTQQAVVYFKSEFIEPSTKEFWAKVESLRTGQNQEFKYFIPYFERFIEERRHRHAIGTVKGYATDLKTLKGYEKHIKKPICFSDIDTVFYNALQKYYYSRTHGKDQSKYSSNSFGKLIKTIKAVYNDAAMNKIHSFGKLNFFKVVSMPADTVYLSTEELDAMMRVELKDPGKIAARAKFMIGAYTGLRISDFNNLFDYNIGDKYLTQTNTKTGYKVIVPINSIVRQIMSEVDIFATVTDKHIREVVKEVAKAAGITQTIEVTEHIAGREARRTVEKWELISSHTARRSFATNAYKAGVPTLSIMKITGHRTENNFMKYIRISKEENAELMAEHPFFR